MNWLWADEFRIKQFSVIQSSPSVRLYRMQFGGSSIITTRNGNALEILRCSIVYVY